MIKLKRSSHTIRCWNISPKTKNWTSCGNSDELYISHKAPGSQITLLIEWENGEITKEPLRIIAADDPVTCAKYARENGLLDQPRWKRFKHIAKMRKSLHVRLTKQN
jgi:hypothetical protein